MLLPWRCNAQHVSQDVDCYHRDKTEDGLRGCFLIKRYELGHYHTSMHITVTIIITDTVLTSGLVWILSKCNR